MSTDLVVQGHAGIDIAEQRARLPELVEAGDAEELHNIAHMAELLRLHEKAMGHAEAANHAGRLKVEAEAGIGVIDIRGYPGRASGMGPQPLRIGEQGIAHNRRMAWRALGYADLQGVLERVLCEIEDESLDTITTSAVVREVRAEGAGHWDKASFMEAMARAQERGATVASVSRQAGTSQDWFYRGSNSTVGYSTGIALARALGIAEADLRPKPERKARLTTAERRRRARVAKVQKREQDLLAKWKQRDDRMRAKGGKVAEMYSLVRRAEQMASTARDSLSTVEAKREFDAAVIDLMEAASKLDNAVKLGS